jgi:uncharacterized protein with ParB-like and HNH nuclease domain
MKADSLKIARVFSGGGDIHYVLPHFQRQYSWEKENWNTLLNDALNIYEEYDPEDMKIEHFLGSLVVINDGTRNGTTSAFKLVDGQQRLTTISLLLSAFRDLIASSDPKTARSVQKLLLNLDADDDLYFKVLPTTKYGDRQAYQAILKGEKVNATESESLIPQAYDFFKKELHKKLASNEIESERFFIVVANCFQVVFIELNKDESPYKIFESLNAKGKILSQSDLVRNYIAMKLPSNKQEKVFIQYWEKIETILQERRTVGKSRIGELTAFIRHYLATQSRVLCSEEHIYARFRDRCEEYTDDRSFIEEISTLCRFASYYNKLLRPQNEKRQEIQNVLHRLNILEIQTSYPFLLKAYESFEKQQTISLKDFLELLTILENYVIRRYVCGEATNYTNKMFPTLWYDIMAEMEGDGTNQSLSLIEATKKVLVTKSYPPDRKVIHSIRVNKIYDNRNRDKVVLILDTINRHLSKGTGGYTVLSDDPTVEHILPQKLTSEWKADLGENSDRTYQDYLHSLGNLTLITHDWNSSLSNSPFSIKKQFLSTHALRINSDYFTKQIDVWNEQSILQRADFLATQFLEIWRALGESVSPTKESYTQPISITIQGEKIDIPNKTWKQLRVQVAEWYIKERPQYFDVLRESINIFADNNEETQGKGTPKDWCQLSNGVYMYNPSSSSAKQHIKYCRSILETAGITDWTINQNQQPLKMS